MKKLRKVLKLLPPAFAMRIWLAKRYGMSVAPAPGGAFTRTLLAVLPFAFTATLSVRKESDIRLMKFFVPYGKMKTFLLRQHRMEIGNAAKDCGISGAMRFVMPYGLVLWWDSEDARLNAGNGNERHPSPEESPDRAAKPSQPFRLSERERQEYARRDKIEAMALRILIENASA